MFLDWWLANAQPVLEYLIRAAAMGFVVYARWWLSCYQEIVGVVWDSVLGELPVVFWSLPPEIKSAMVWANYWVPVDYGLFLGVSWISLASVMVSVKGALMFVPGV